MKCTRVYKCEGWVAHKFNIGGPGATMEICENVWEYLCRCTFSQFTPSIAFNELHLNNLINPKTMTTITIGLIMKCSSCYRFAF